MPRFLLQYSSVVWSDKVIEAETAETAEENLADLFGEDADLQIDSVKQLKE